MGKTGCWNRVRSLALLLALFATGGAWAGKLGEGITAYYQFNVGSSFTGQKWDTDALVDDANLAFSCSGNIQEAGKLGDYPKFSDNTVLNGGSGGCYVQNASADSAYPSTSGNWTISLWAKRNGATSHPCLYHHGPSATYTASAMVEPTSGSNGGIAIYVLSDGKVKVGFSVSSDGSTFSYNTITSSAAFTWANAQANWHHVVVKRDGTTVSLLVDGITQGTATINASDNLSLDASSRLSLSGTSAMGWQNSTEDLCVWNRALSQGEVAAIAGGSAPISALANQTIESYTFSNVDSDSLAVKSDGKFGTTSFSFQLNNPSANAATANFPASGYVQLTKISIGARSDDNYQSVTTATLTNNKTLESYAATVTYSSGDDFTAVAPGSWSRKEVKVTFGTDGVLVDTTATYTLTFTETLGYSVVTTVSSPNTGDWKPAMRIYGRTPSGSMEMPSSLIPSSGGMTLPSTVTVADAMGMAFANDSVTIGNSGIQIPLSSALNTQTVMVKAVIPSSSSRLIGWKVSDAIEAYTSYTGSQFEQHFLNNGTVYSTTYGTSAWTRDANEHWLAVAYDRGSDTSTYLDGAKKITATNLKWGTLQTSKVTIGGTAYNTTDAATGMVIKDVQIYNQSLGSERVAKVVAALNSGWTVNAAGTTLTSAQAGSPLPGYENVQVYGTVTVAADGSLDLSGISQVLVGNGATLDVSGVSGLTYAAVTSGGVLTIGKQRPVTVVVTAGGTLAVTSDDATMSDRITGYTPTATLTVSGAIAGTVTLDGETVTPVVDGSTATLTGTAVAGDPTYTGNGWWWDYEFNGNGNNIGSDGVNLSWDGDRPLQGSEYTTADETGNQMLHLPARPWRDVTAYPSEFTAVMFCKAGATANGVLVAFGSTTYGSYKTITLSTGANPSAGQMRLVYGNYTDSATDLVEGGFTLDNITSANHLYAFTVKTVGGVSQIAVYADGDLLTTYTADSLISLGTGFQIASGHGGLPSGLSRLANDDAATMDFLRVSNVALSDAAIKALAAEYRYVSPNGIAERTLSANATWTDETNTSWSQKTLNEDGSTTTTAQAAPNSGTVVEITASTDVQLTMDLASDVSYEKLTFQGDGAITVKAGGTAPTVTTRTYINTDVTMDIAAFASLGATTIADGKTLTVVPDEESTLNAGIALGIRGETSTIVTGTVTLGTDSQVVLPSSMVSDFASYGFTLTLTPDASGRYVYTIARDDNPVHITKAANGTITYAMYPDALAGTPAAMMLTLPAEPATIPADFTYMVTIVNNHASESLAVAADFAGGSIAVSSGAVELSGAITTSGNLTFNSATTLSGTSTISGEVSGTGILTVSGTVTLTSTGTIANTVIGNGRVVFVGKLPASNLQTSFQDSSNWTGTVELKDYTETTDAHKIIVLTKYGNSKSTVALNGVTSTMYTGNNTYPDVTLRAIEIGEGGWSDNDGLSYTVSPLYKADLTGHGTITVKTGNAGTVRFVGNHTFDGSIAFGNNTGKQVAFMKTANDTLPSVTAGAIVVADGVNMTIASGKSWTAPGGISVCGTLKAVGSALISGSVAVSETGTLDISAFTGATPAIPGALTLADGATLKLPGGTTFPYQIANSGTACIITGNYTIGEDAGTASGLELSEDGYLDTANMVTIATDTVLSDLEAGGKYLYKVTANATVDASGVAANVGMIQFIVDPGVRLKLSAEPACPFSISGDAFAIAGSDNRHFTATAAAEYYPSIGTLSSSGTSITIDNASSLSAGVYPLARWITPQKKSTGYGHVATLVTTGLADGLTAELVYCVDRVVLRVYDTAAQAAKGTLKVWPFGDSITEGFNAGGTKANYRVLLAQKLSLLGFNVEMVGCYDKINGANGIDPSGQEIPNAWKWHSAKHGATAGPTTSAAGRANLCENVDTLSAQAGNPDVVLLLAGANDIVPATGRSAQQVVNSITNIVAHLATNLPDSKIVVGTQINVESGYNSGNYTHVTNMIPQVNSLLKTYVDNLPAELSGKVFLADLNSYVKSGEYGILFDHGSDHLHPDWWGHDQMAEGWLSVITNKFTATQVFPSATVPAAPTTEELGAAAKEELAAYRKGFKLARRIDAASNLDTAAPYAATGNGATEGIQKVAYFVEYVRADNNAHKWVWVDMDAFGDCDLATIGLPATNHQQVVTKLHVKSNHNGIDDVAADDDSVTGFIEFSPFDYNGNVSGVSGEPAGNASCCDWNDTLSDSGTYGCMQVHRVFSPAKSAADGVTRGGQVLFAYNNWRSSTSTAEFGIGNFSSHFYRGANDAQSLDYTYTANATKMNADAYSVKRIEIWTKKVYGTIFSVW